LWRIDPDSDQLRLKDVWHVPSQRLSEFENASRSFVFSEGIGLPGRVWEKGQPVWITDVVVDSNFPRSSIASRLGIHGAMAFPILRKNEVIGIMGFFTKNKCLPDNEVFDLMADIGRRVSVFINQKLAERALEERSCLATLNADVGLILTRGDALQDILQQCAEAMVRNLGVAFARIWTLNKEENVLELQSSAGIYTHLDGAHSRVPVGMHKLGLIARERKPHLTNAVLDDPLVHNQEWAKQMGMAAFAGYPLIVEDRLVGVMAVFSRKPLTEVTLKALTSVSDIIALGIERKRIEETRVMLSDILETTTDFVGTASVHGDVFYVNKAGRKMLGIGENEDVKKLKIHNGHPGWTATLIFEEAIPQAIKNGVWMGETVMVNRDGCEIHVSQVIIAHRKANGNVEYLSTIARDITDRKHYESQILHMANRDPLTNLFNRRRFQEELKNCIMQTKRFGTHGALIFLDIDNFKDINDSFGHQVGDKLLVNLANILKERLREVDILSRLGGDEFAIILSGADGHHAMLVANHLRELIRQEVSIIEGKTIDITTSMGIALFPKHSELAEALSSYADLAMYRAKEEGRNRVCLYTPEQKTQIEVRLIWEKHVREALRQKRLVLHLQPLLDLCQNCIIGYEVLLCMTDEKGELIYSNQFLNIVERFGLIRDVDQWVVSESIALIKELDRKGIPSHLGINLSGKSLNDNGLLQLIRKKLEETGIDPVNVVFEICESAAIENVVDTERFIQDLKHFGCRFALDDFGIGFSSFNYLKHLSVDYLKIEGSFIQNLQNSPADQHLVRAIVEVVHGLGKKIIAKSVGSTEAIHLLREFGVDYAQGCFIGKPKPFIEL
jgi:diguanylate cyclase (GGDEF)-like protein/PAS domain S-box-containing protein